MHCIGRTGGMALKLGEKSDDPRLFGPLTGLPGSELDIAGESAAG